MTNDIKSVSIGIVNSSSLLTVDCSRRQQSTVNITDGVTGNDMTNDSLGWGQLFFAQLGVPLDNLAKFVALDRFFIQQRFDKFVYQSAVFADNPASFFVAVKGNFPDLPIDLDGHVFGILRSRIPVLPQKHLIVLTF